MKKSRVQSVISVALCVAMLLSVLPTAGFAVAAEEVVMLERPRYESYDSEQTLSRLTDLDELKDVLRLGVTACEEKIDVSAFALENTGDLSEALSELLFKELAETFHVSGAGITVRNGYVVSINVRYAYTGTQYNTMLAAMRLRAAELTADLAGLSDAEKALLLHDRLAVICEYDYSFADDAYGAYGALVKGEAVCQGYAIAYDYMLEMVGIESYICSSTDLNHAWNIVFVDGTPYHVDVTWDDMPWYKGERGVIGAVRHDNFLRSTDGIRETGHEAWDFDAFPADTTYDDCRWQNSKTAFCLVDGELYYVDNEAAQLKRFRDEAVLCSVASPSNIYWRATNHTRLSDDGCSLLFTLSDGVYKYDVATGTVAPVYQPILADEYAIYGMMYEDGHLVCDINMRPPGYSGAMDTLYQECPPYTPAAPTRTVTDVAIIANPTKVTYYLGDTLHTDGLKLKVTYSDGSTKTVTSGYTVNGFASTYPGTKTVTVSYSDRTDTFTVAVKAPTIFISPYKVEMDMAQTYPLHATTTPDGQAVTWSSSDTSVVTVSDGRITTGAVGTAMVTAKFTYNGRTYSASCEVTVAHTHTFADATCTAPQTCTKCGAIGGKALGHSYKTTTTKATLSANGKAVKKCTVCGYVASTTAISKVKSVSFKKAITTYDGKTKKPSVVVKDSKGKTLKLGTDYTVTYPSGMKNAGTYKVKVTMKGNYSGTKTLTYTIKPIDVSTCKISFKKATATYDGKTKTPSVVVKNAGGTTLKKGTHYKVVYPSGMKNVGTYKVKVVMQGNYGGTKTLTYKINPPATSISKLTAGKKSFTAAISKKTTQVTGYEVQYSTSKKFASAKTKVIPSAKTTKATIKSLSAKKTYYVRVRTYKTVNGKKYYSGWSTYKAVKTK